MESGCNIVALGEWNQAVTLLLWENGIRLYHCCSVIMESGCNIVALGEWNQAVPLLLCGNGISLYQCFFVCESGRTIVAL